MKDLKEVFDDKGNFNLRSFDPYRLEDSEECKSTWDALFSCDDYGYGDLKDGVREFCVQFIKEKEVSPFSDIVQLFYAGEHGSNTNGSYPAIYMWR